MVVYTWMTSHLSHWSWDHLWWDLLAFGILSATAIRLAGYRYFSCLGLAAFAIPIELFLFQQHLITYRGLSGIDSAIFGLIAYQLFKLGGMARVFGCVAASGFAFKTLYEMLSGSTVFVVNTDQLFTSVPSAHLVGFACGVVAGLVTLKPVKRFWSLKLLDGMN